MKEPFELGLYSAKVTFFFLCILHVSKAVILHLKVYYDNKKNMKKTILELLQIAFLKPIIISISVGICITLIGIGLTR